MFNEKGIVMKRVFIIPVLCMSLGTPLFAQLATFDVANLLETIHNGYLTYQSVLNSIEQIKYAYESTQIQLQQIQQLKIEDIQSFTDAVNYVDKQVDFVRQTENRFKSISMNVGGTNIPLTEFYKAPGAAYDMVKDNMTAKMSDWEKARAWSHFGLNPANYFYLKAWGGRIEEASKQLVVVEEVIKENNQKTAKEVKEIADKANQSGSELAVLQASMAMLQILIGEQQEANRLTASALQYQATKDKAGELPAQDNSNIHRVSRDWL